MTYRELSCAWRARTAEMAFEGPDPIRIHEEHHLFGVVLHLVSDHVDKRGDDVLFAASKVPRSFTFWDWCATLSSKCL